MKVLALIASLALIATSATAADVRSTSKSIRLWKKNLKYKKTGPASVPSTASPPILPPYCAYTQDGATYTVPRVDAQNPSILTADTAAAACAAIASEWIDVTPYNLMAISRAAYLCLGPSVKAFARTWNGGDSGFGGVAVQSPPLDGYPAWVGNSLPGQKSAALCQKKAAVPGVPRVPGSNYDGCSPPPAPSTPGAPKPCNHPSGGNIHLVVTPQPILRSEATTVCAAQGWEVAGVRADDDSFTKAQDLILANVGQGGRAWIASWNGDSYTAETPIAITAGADNKSGAINVPYGMADAKIAAVVCVTPGTGKRSEL
ncbi:hypothetical protein BC828DRAFT_383579 [Blastocladiella britannica]|nr:hypothetical protein BC828DRAFT_383579 [Blastocladiella britannica]